MTREEEKTYMKEVFREILLEERARSAPPAAAPSAVPAQPGTPQMAAAATTPPTSSTESVQPVPVFAPQEPAQPAPVAPPSPRRSWPPKGREHEIMAIDDIVLPIGETENLFDRMEKR